MKKTFSTLFLIIPYILFAQENITKETKIPRDKDILIKKEVAYKAPGRSGDSVIWDFSNLKYSNTDFIERYTGKIDSILVCTNIDGNTQYKLINDTLLNLGYNNPNMTINYIVPAINRVYPLSLKDSISSYFYGEGVYGQKLPVVIIGETTIICDAKGRLILPDEIVIEEAIRVKETIKIIQKVSSSSNIYSNGDNMRYCIDSLRHHIKNAENTWHYDSYKWYAKGFRYPIFETMQSGFIINNTLSTRYNRSYSLMPENQKYEFEDAINEQIREEIEFEKQIKYSKKQADSQDKNNINFNYNYHISNNSDLTIEYYSEEAQEVNIYINHITGYNLWHKSSISNSSVSTSHYNMAMLRPGCYILSIVFNGKIYNQTIQKL